MRKGIAIMLVMAIMLGMFINIAQATRAEDLQKRYMELAQQRIKINEELLRIEGAFGELQRIEAEAKARAEEIVDVVNDPISTD